MAKYYDFASMQAGLAAFASYAPKFSLDPKKSQGLNLPVALKWKRRPFLKSNALAISDDLRVLDPTSQARSASAWLCTVHRTGGCV